MADAGEGRQTWAQKIEAQNKAQQKELKKKPNPEKIGEQRVAHWEEKFRKGKEIFQQHMDRLKAKGREVAVGALAAPEKISGKIDAIKLGVGEKVGNILKTTESWDNNIANGVESGMASLTGAVESGVLNIKAGVTEAGAKYNSGKQERVKSRMENGHQVVRASIEAKKALIAKLQESLAADEATLANRLGEDQTKLEGAEARELELSTAAQENRVEAQKRKGNGKGLGGVRKLLHKVIAPGPVFGA